MDYGDSICDNPDCQHPFSFHGVYGCLHRHSDRLKVFCDCRRDPRGLRGSPWHAKLRRYLEFLGYPETESDFAAENGIHQYDHVDSEVSEEEPYIPRPKPVTTWKPEFKRAIDLI